MSHPRILLATASAMLAGCAGGAPSMARFMAPGIASVSGAWSWRSGDLVEEPRDWDSSYVAEADNALEVGSWIGDPVRVGLAFGSGGLTPSLGFRSTHLGAMAWGNLDLSDGGALSTGGIAFAQQLHPRPDFRLGVLELAQRASSPELTAGELFSGWSGSRTRDELGGGLYAVGDLAHLALGLELRQLHELGSPRWRTEITLSVSLGEAPGS